MKKTSKRITGIALSAMMMVSALPATNSLIGGSGSFISAITANAADYITSNGIKYQINSSTKEAYVCGQANTASNLSIPLTIKANGITFKVTQIQAKAFYNNTTLKTIDLSTASNLKMINGSAFENCKNLNKVTFASTQTDISFGDSVFSDCLKLTTITLPNKVKKFGNGMFYNCESLTAVTLPSNIQYLDNASGPKGFFQNCQSLQKITIPATCTSISELAFKGCTGLKTFKVESGSSNYTAVGGILFSKDKKTLIKYPSSNSAILYSIPEGVNCIYSFAFENVQNLVELDLRNCTADKLTGVFSGANKIRRVVIPNLEKKLEKAKFLYNISNIFEYKDFESINGQPIVSCPKNAKPSLNPYFVDAFDAFLIADSENEKLKNKFYTTFDSEEVPFMNKYCNAYADYVIATVISNGDSEFTKALKLQKWITNRVSYYPKKLSNTKTASHCACAVFLHKEKIDNKEQYYAVCAGYSRCYALLLKRAGIDAKYVVSEKLEHGWNLVKIDGRYYHFDVTWDDSWLSYDNFMKTSDEYSISHISQSEWEVYEFDETGNTLSDDKIISLPDSSVSTKWIGDVDKNNIFDSNDPKTLANLIAKNKADTLNADMKYRCDINMDGKVDTKDTNLLDSAIKAYQKSDKSQDLFHFILNNNMITQKYNSRFIADESIIAAATDQSTVTYGDANCDGKVDMGDSVLIMQSICDPAKFGLNGSEPSRITEEGYRNADCCNVGDGVTNEDALAIQKFTLSLIPSLPENK